AALAYIGLLASLLSIALQRAWSATTATHRLRAYLLAAGLLIWIVISNLNFPLERLDHLLIFAAYTALILFPTKISHPQNHPTTLRFAQLLISAISMLFLLLFLFAGQRWQKDRHLHQLLAAHQNGQSAQVLEIAPHTTGPFFSVEYFSATPILWYQGTALLQSGQTQAARDAFLQAYQINPFHPHVLNNLAATYVMRNEHAEAEKYYREAIARFRDFPDPYINLSKILQAAGRTNEARQILESFPEKAQTHKKAISRALQMMGN
ncbi:MAG: tetratricopeptide repeat protein, partial [Bacteroidota bacterium]